MGGRKEESFKTGSIRRQRIVRQTERQCTCQEALRVGR